MPTAAKLAIGLMALWGTVYAVAVLVADFALVPPPGGGQVQSGGIERVVIHLHAANALAVFLIEAGIALSLGRLPVHQRVIWVFAMMFFYPLAIPGFWYLHIWRSPPPSVSSEGPPSTSS